MISIIIIVKNDPSINNTLRCLMSIHDPQEIEIIVIDASEGKLIYLKNSYPLVTWVDFLSLKDKKTTIPEQRNLGITKSKGDIIVFIDAGCIPAKDWLRELVRPILNDKEDIVSGSVRSPDSSSFHEQVLTINKGKKYISECPTMNVAIRRYIFDQIGYFDEEFFYGSDVDFFWRSIDAGYRIRYAENAQVSHDWGDVRQDLKRSYIYGKARAKLYKKHGLSRIKYLVTHDITTIIYPLYILGLPVTLMFPYYPLLILIPLIKNRKHHPLQVIRDHFIYGSGVITGIVQN